MGKVNGTNSPPYGLRTGDNYADWKQNMRMSGFLLSIMLPRAGAAVRCGKMCVVYVPSPCAPFAVPRVQSALLYSTCLGANHPSYAFASTLPLPLSAAIRRFALGESSFPARTLFPPLRHGMFMNVPAGFDAASSGSRKPESLIDRVGTLDGFVSL